MGASRVVSVPCHERGVAATGLAWSVAPSATSPDLARIALRIVYETADMPGGAMRASADYGIDAPGKVLGSALLGLVALAAGVGVRLGRVTAPATVGWMLLASAGVCLALTGT